MKIIQEFKKFAIKGNAIDLAVGVVIGAAFGKIVTSLVEDIINPPLGLITGSIDFNDKVLVIKAATESSAAIVLKYGSFITSLINFIIVAFAIFMIVKQVNKLKDADKEEVSAPKISPEVQVLSEIRDLLKK